MPPKTQTSADLKFLNGNFIEASALYTEALLRLDDASNDAEVASLLLKLGDSQYAAGLYQEALGTYRRLLELQVQCGLSEREKISTHLKLAQTYDLSDEQKQAESEFQTAYEMSELHLPAQHFLWRSVIGCYVSWLKKNGRNPDFLAKLQIEIATPVTFEVSGSLEEPRAELEDQTTTSAEALRAETKFDLQARSTKLASDFPVRHDVAMRQSMRSFFNEGANINNSDHENYHSDSESRERKAASKEVQRHLSNTMPLALAVLVGIVVIVVISFASARPSAAEFPSFYRALAEKTFITSDGSLSFTAGPDGLTLTRKGISNTIKPVFWKGSFRDDISLLRGDYRQCVWLYPSARGMQDQSGVEFFPETEIEGRTIRVMHNIAARAQSFYSAYGRYPVPDEIQSMFLYRNPDNQNLEQLPVYKMNSYYKKADKRSKGLESNLESGQYFNGESAGRPGSVAVLCVINKQHGFVEVPNSPVESQIMYIHSFDRDGKLITCPGSDKTLLLILDAGKTEKSEDMNILDKYSGATFCVSAKQPPVAASVFFKYFAWLIALTGISVYLQWVYARSKREESIS